VTCKLGDKGPLNQHILLVNLSLLLTHVVGDIYPQSVLGDTVLVIVLVQVDGIPLKLNLTNPITRTTLPS